MTGKLLFQCFAVAIIASCSSGAPESEANNSKLNTAKIDSLKVMTQKKFSEPENTAVFTTKFVITDNKVITEVHHDDDDGAWQFFSDDHFDDFSKVAKVVGLGQITKIDSTLFEIADMPTGHVAYRKFKGDKWIIEKKK